MADRYKVVLLFGPPGSGKGTQGKCLGHVPGLRHLATGDMFRSLDPASDIGKRVVQYSSKGELVPDELTIELFKDYVRKQVDDGRYRPANDLLLLDGIPRSVGQASALDETIEVLRIVHLNVPNIDDMVQRMKKRAEEQGRKDDADENVIRRRFAVYDQETAPVLGYYSPDLVADVDPTGLPVEVMQRALDAIVPVYSGQFENPLG